MQSGSVVIFIQFREWIRWHYSYYRGLGVSLVTALAIVFNPLGYSFSVHSKIM